MTSGKKKKKKTIPKYHLQVYLHYFTLFTDARSSIPPLRPALHKTAVHHIGLGPCFGREHIAIAIHEDHVAFSAQLRLDLHAKVVVAEKDAGVGRGDGGDLGLAFGGNRRVSAHQLGAILGDLGGDHFQNGPAADTPVLPDGRVTIPKHRLVVSIGAAGVLGGPLGPQAGVAVARDPQLPLQVVGDSGLLRPVGTSENTVLKSVKSNNSTHFLTVLQTAPAGRSSLS